MVKVESKQRQAARKRPLSKFARDLRAAWKELGLPQTDATVVVAVSGGADSTALLLALDELIKSDKLGVTLLVAHLDHGLRKNSGADARWVKRLARELGYDAVIGKAQIKTSSRKRSGNLEQEARKKRYDFLLRTAIKMKARLVLTAHTLDDQAETVLLRLLRGSAAEGLQGASVVRPLQKGSKVMLARPLLSWARRRDTENYCRSHGIVVRDDDMNEDESFSRVRIRKQLLPLMESFNRRIVETLSRTASLLGEDANALGSLATQLLEVAHQAQSNNLETTAGPLDVSVLLQAPAAVRRRALREWLGRARGDLRRLERGHLLAVEKLLTSQGGRVAELPGSFKVTKKGAFLRVSQEKRLKKPSAASKLSGR